MLVTSQLRVNPKVHFRKHIIITTTIIYHLQVIVGGEVQIEESSGKTTERKKEKPGSKIFSALTPKRKKKKKEKEESNPILDSVRFIPIEVDADDFEVCKFHPYIYCKCISEYLYYP